MHSFGTEQKNIDCALDKPRSWFKRETDWKKMKWKENLWKI